MGNYASTDELQTRFADAIEVSYLTDTEDTGTPDSAVLDDVLEGAEGSINSRIGKRYLTPVVVSGNTELTALLKRHTLDLAEVFLLMRGPSLSDAKAFQRDRVLEWADKVGDGTYVLTGAVTPESTASRDPLSQWSGGNRTIPDSSGRLFTRDKAARL